jgi:pimeloyl-ACP methyl ester carboxylesterase
MQINESTWRAACAADGEFREAARFWTGGLVLHIGTEALSLRVEQGQVSVNAPSAVPVIEYSGSESTWTQVLAQNPPRFHNDLMANLATGSGLAVRGDPLMHAQYYGAIMRAIELLRPAAVQSPLSTSKAEGEFDAPQGRYVHLQLGGHDHRVYFEEAGQGIPVLLQHTAGCHGSQWRHLFECRDITSRFRLIAYDLPMHGKSLPPVTREWWSEPYTLRGDFLRSVPLVLSRVLGLDRPVFMGCSVGGLLALDLAHKHADQFRAVIAVEGALRIGGDLAALSMLYHPQVSNAYKARLMDGLMAPASPLALRRETGFVYASGWPPAFVGDLHYYVDEFDLRAVAASIDTRRVGVHVMSGEYDYSGRSELGAEAHASIPGSTFTEMRDMGHFPMSENPDAFIHYLLPILSRIAA